MTFPTSKRKPQARYAKLDGKPPPKPRGRHAAASPDDSGTARKTITIPANQRLGFRVREFAALTGLSYPTIWRRIKSGKIKTVDVGGVKLVSRAFAVECGLLNETDNG